VVRSVRSGIALGRFLRHGNVRPRTVPSIVAIVRQAKGFLPALLFHQLIPCCLFDRRVEVLDLFMDRVTALPLVAVSLGLLAVAAITFLAVGFRLLAVAAITFHAVSVSLGLLAVAAITFLAVGFRLLAVL
jgi:hypothetical protein